MVEITVRHVLSGILILPAAYFMIMNWAMMVALLLRTRNVSLIPIAGGLMASIGCHVSAFAILREYWYVPLFLDPGTLPLIASTSVYLVVRRFHPGNKSDES